MVNKAEGKLPKSIFSKIQEVDWPALRSFSDFFYCLTEGAFKIDGRNWAALSIPGQRRQIFLLRLSMKSKRLTYHATTYVPFAGPLPKKWFPPCRIEPHAGGARLLAARRRRRRDRRRRPGWRLSFRPVQHVRHPAGPGPFAAVLGLLGSWGDYKTPVCASHALDRPSLNRDAIRLFRTFHLT
jgi:hypothetical protein